MLRYILCKVFSSWIRYYVTLHGWPRYMQLIIFILTISQIICCILATRRIRTNDKQTNHSMVDSIPIIDLFHWLEWFAFFCPFIIFKWNILIEFKEKINICDKLYILAINNSKSRICALLINYKCITL